jgi:hypothetical protein
VDSVDELAAVALSGESVPLELYRYVSAHHEPVAPEEVARAVGVSLKLAALHLDRLVGAEMFDFRPPPLRGSPWGRSRRRKPR